MGPRQYRAAREWASGERDPRSAPPVATAGAYSVVGTPTVSPRQQTSKVAGSAGATS